MTFAGQVAVVTGASSGIGWELGKELARQGCAVGLVARRRDNLEKLAGEIRAAGGKTAIATADVADRTQTLTAIHTLRAELGPIDLLVANAGVGAPTRLDPPNISDIEKMFQVNMLGVVYALEAVMPEMLARKQGHVAAVSSLAAYKGLPGESAYCASKAALNVYLEGLRIELRGRGVAVTTICPGFVKTPMTEVNDFHMPWLLTPDAAARRIVGALRRKVAVYNFPWQMGLMMRAVGWLPDWVVARVMAKYDENPRFPPGPL